MGTGTFSPAGQLFRYPLPAVVCLLIIGGCVNEPGPGTTVRRAGYAVTTPNDAWELPEGRGLRLARREGDADETAYLELQPYDDYLDDEDYARENGLTTIVHKDLETLLRREVETRATDVRWIAGPAVWTAPTIGVLLHFTDAQDQLNTAGRAVCFNEAALILVGGELHFHHAYGYADRLPALREELDALRNSLVFEGRRLFPTVEPASER